VTRLDPFSLLARTPLTMREGEIATDRLERIRLGAWCAVIALGLTSAWLGLMGLGALTAAGDLSGALATARAHSAGPALIAFVVVVLLAERLWPAVERPLLARAHIVDAAYLALFVAVVLPLLTLVQTGLAVEVARHAGFLMVSRLGPVPQVAVVGAVLIAIDAMNWAAHLANHRAHWPSGGSTLSTNSQEEMSVLTVTVTFRNGLIGSAAGSGYELNLALAALALVVVLLGTGRFSLDVVGRRLLEE
jgi:hypothetical protein